MAVESVADALSATRDRGSMVDAALADILGGDPIKRKAGLMNILVWGRAVTNTLQRIRGIDSGFDEWYAPWQKEMSNDPLLRYFYKMRSKVLKEGEDVEATGSFYINSFDTRTDMQRLGPAPPGATSFFMGDPWGRSGWHIRLPNGEEMKYYVNVPSDIAVSDVTLTEAPDTHLGSPILDKSIGNLCTLYREYLRRMSVSAREFFTAAKES
jgi:hypothetical protein